MKRIRLTLLLFAFLGVSAYAEPSGWVTSDEQSFACGETIQIEAQANQGFQFDHWSDGIRENPRSIEVLDTSIYTAYFVSVSTPTAIDDAQVAPTVQKVLIDNKVYILRGENLYDILGKKVK